MKKAVALVALLLFVTASSAAFAATKKKETVGPTGQPRAAICLNSCREQYRAQPGFLQNPANKWFCWKKCGMG